MLFHWLAHNLVFFIGVEIENIVREKRLLHYQSGRHIFACKRAGGDQAQVWALAVVVAAEEEEVVAAAAVVVVVVVIVVVVEVAAHWDTAQSNTVQLRTSLVKNLHQWTDINWESSKVERSPVVVAEQVQEVQTRHKTQFWSSSNFVLMFKLHPIFYSVAAKCKTSLASKYQLLVHQVPAQMGSF